MVVEVVFVEGGGVLAMLVGLGVVVQVVIVSRSGYLGHSARSSLSSSSFLSGWLMKGTLLLVH